MEQRIIADIMYSAVEIARLLHTDIQNVYKWVKTGEIPHIKLNEKSEIRFAGWEIRAWLDSKATGGSLND